MRYTRAATYHIKHAKSNLKHTIVTGSKKTGEEDDLGHPKALQMGGTSLQNQLRMEQGKLSRKAIELFGTIKKEALFTEEASCPKEISTHIQGAGSPKDVKGPRPFRELKVEKEKEIGTSNCCNIGKIFPTMLIPGHIPGAIFEQAEVPGHFSKAV